MIDLRKIFAGIKGNAFVGIDTTTVVKLKGGKKNPMQGRVKKHMRGAVVMAFSSSAGYANMVPRRLNAEGNPEGAVAFKVQPRKWGVRVKGLPVVEHKGKDYGEFIFLRAGEVYYTLDGNPINKEDIIGLDENKREAYQGGLSDENKVIIRTFAADSIDAIRVNGKEYRREV